MTNKTPDIGVYLDVPAVDYHSWKLASYSSLNLLAKSPAHLAYVRENPDVQTPAQVVGEAIHMAVLQPLLFPLRFLISPAMTKASKVYKDLVAENPGLTVLTHDEAVHIEKVATAVRAHPTVSKLLSHPNGIEVSGVFELAGVRCKMRCDLINERFSTVLDLKTTTDASEKAFLRSIVNYGYHRQAAMYLDGWAALGKPYQHFLIISIEKEPPHGIALYRLSNAFIEQGRKELRQLLTTYADCEKSDKWPSYPATVTELNPPKWLREAA